MRIGQEVQEVLWEVGGPAVMGALGASIKKLISLKKIKLLKLIKVQKGHMTEIAREDVEAGPGCPCPHGRVS